MHTFPFNFLVLHNVRFKVTSHGDGIDLDESQSGYLLASIETPLRKKRMTGRAFSLHMWPNRLCKTYKQRGPSLRG